MIRIIGWIFNTLNYQVENELKGTIYQNKEYRDNKWNYIEKQLLIWSAKPVANAARLLLAVLLVSIALFLSVNYVHIIFPGYVSIFSSESSFNYEPLVDWQSTLLTVQITLIGVVYPMVIALIGVLLQRKSAARAIWTVYHRYSGFLFTSLSGLCLSIVLIVAKLSEAIIPAALYFALILSMAGWLLLNLLLTGWFFWATFETIQDKRRSKILMQYCANESFIADIRTKLSENIPKEALDRGLVSNHAKAIVEFYQFGSVEGYDVYDRHFKTEREVKNISFALLNLAIFVWLKLTSKSNYGDREIVLPLFGGSKSSVWRVATYKNVGLPPVARFLLRSAYISSNPKSFKEDSLQDVIDSLLGGVEDAMEDNNRRLFDEAVRDLKEWNSQIIRTLAHTNEAGESRNWLLLQPARFFGSSYLNQILHEYSLLTNSAVRKIPQSSQYIEKFMYLHLGIVLKSGSETPGLLIKEYVKGHHDIWVSLMNWRGSNITVIGTPLHNDYANSLMKYVSSWEAWSRAFRGELIQLRTRSESLQPTVSHLECSARAVISAIRANDVEATEWAVDVLNNWYSNMSVRGRNLNEYRWNSEILVLNMIGEDTNNPAWEFVLNGAEYEPRSAVNVSLKNAWRDVRVVTACYLLSRANGEPSVEFSRSVSALLSGERLHPSGGVERGDKHLSSGSDVLSAYLRHRWLFAEEGPDYGSWIDSIVDAFSSIDSKRRVSGRVHLSHGRNNVQSLKRSYVKLAVDLSMSKWSLNGKWARILASGLLNQDHKSSIIFELKGWVSVIEEELLPDQARVSIRRAHAENCRDSLMTVIDGITEQNQRAIIDAALDYDRLSLYGKNASKSAFSANAGLPLSLFETITYDLPRNDELITTIRISNYAKEDVAIGVSDNEVDLDWLEPTFSEEVGNAIFDDFLQYSRYKTEHVEFPDYKALLTALHEDISEKYSNEGEFIFLIGSPLLSEELDELMYASPDTSSLNIEIHESFDSDYMCHFNGVEVYFKNRADMNSGLMFSRTAFAGIKFHDLGGEQFVDAKFIEDGPDSITGTLEFSYWKETEFQDEKVIKYSVVEALG
jgi:hypothetical protein